MPPCYASEGPPELGLFPLTSAFLIAEVDALDRPIRDPGQHSMIRGVDDRLPTGRTPRRILLGDIFAEVRRWVHLR
jgi:hypothetical protein